MMEQYLEEICSDPLERLRWYVAKRLDIAPYCQSDGEVIKCALNMLADKLDGAEFHGNSAFDEGRFRAMRGGGAAGA